VDACRHVLGGSLTGHTIDLVFLFLGWVNDYPEDCDSHKGECREEIVSFFFGGLPAILAFALIVGNNLLVYWHVRTTIQKSIRRFQGNPTPPGISNSASEANNNYTKRSSIFKSMKRVLSQPAHSAAQGRPGADPQLQRVRAVATQAFFYVGAFMITYVPAAGVRILAGLDMGAEEEGKFFPLLLIQSLMLPSQGLFNVLVYIRPSFWRTRRDYPNESIVWALRRALYGEGVQPTKDRIQRQPSSSDFGGLIVYRLQTTRGASVLQEIGMADLYPDNYWCSDDENDGKRQIRRKSSQYLEDEESNNYRGPPEHLAGIDDSLVADITSDGIDGKEERSGTSEAKSTSKEEGKSLQPGNNSDESDSIAAEADPPMVEESVQ
jgi:hypothetical protein